MTNEELINELVRHKQEMQNDFGWNTTLQTALDVAIEALKKEIPKPVSIENGFVKCGGCGMYIRFPIIDRYNNCPECGQKILWKAALILKQKD